MPNCSVRSWDGRHIGPPEGSVTAPSNVNWEIHAKELMMFMMLMAQALLDGEVAAVPTK